MSEVVKLAKQYDRKLHKAIAYYTLLSNLECLNLQHPKIQHP